MQPRRLVLSALCALFTLAGCGHKVSVGYLESADVDLGDGVHQILVIDRVGADNAAESFIDAAEAVLSGEGLDGDRDTAEIALQGLMAVLQQTGRYEVELMVDGKQVDQALFGGTLDPKEVQKLCRRHECDAIVSLDALDTDTSAQVEVTRDTTGRSAEATSTTQLTATFRSYDADGSMLDSHYVRSAVEDSSEDDTTQGALSGLADPIQIQRDLAWEAGVMYGQRIAPHEVLAERRLYATGSPELKEASKHVKAGDWAGAVAIWKQVRAQGSAKDAAKARYNLAIGKELHGDLDGAIKLATRAAVALDSGRSRGYVADLTARQADLERLAQQMSAADAG
ncbi:MAG: hypothetical protein H6738_10815 [Alphaproteobacteria bacterium]|nr:hypothetical protein [Alphaproteobacteria bacterium]MCB9697262.1 hypothetical protein [Alphaproteobacteria bacterium]